MPVMFEGNSEVDDIAMLVNLIYQSRDIGGMDGVTAYDPGEKIDWGVDDVLAYIRRKYGIEVA